VARLSAAPEAGLRIFRDGYALWQQGNAIKAYAYFDQITSPIPPIDDLRLYATATTALETGRVQHAAAVYEQLIRQYPHSPWRAAAEKKLSAKTPVLSEVVRLQEAAQLLKRNLPAEAAAILEPLVRVSTGGMSGETAILDLLATALFRAREYAKAVPVLAELLRRKGDNDVQLMMSLASAYARSNQFDEAIAMQRRISQFPQEARKAHYKIVFLEFDRGRNREAITAAQEYLEQYPNSSDQNSVVWMRAWAHLRLKEWPTAIAVLEVYRDTVGGRGEKQRAEYWIARCLEAMGNNAGAATAFGVLASQDSGGFYGYLASARLRHKPIPWQLQPAKLKGMARFGEAGTKAAVLSEMGFYELMPVVGGVDAYRNVVEKVAPAWGLTPELVLSLMNVESHFQANAASSAGALGLMQLILPTARQLVTELHLDGVFQDSDLRDPIWNVTLGMSYLRKLSGMFSRQLVPVIASYNAGEQAVTRWMSIRPMRDVEMFIEEIPYDETRAYVKKVLAGMW
jgi:soluble lytic murein transglycosylase